MYVPSFFTSACCLQPRNDPNLCLDQDADYNNYMLSSINWIICYNLLIVNEE